MPLKIRGTTGNWLRVELPEASRGFVHQSLVDQLNEPTGEMVATEIIFRRKLHYSSHARKITGKNETVKVWTEYNSHLLIEAGGVSGWIEDVI